MTPARSDALRLSDPLQLDDLLLYRLARLLGVASTMVIRLCEGRYGITRREWRLVALLAQEGGMRPSQLAERIQLDRARTSRAITSLVSKRLLARSVAPGDRRQALVILTPAGRELYEALFPQVRRINQDLLRPLSETHVRRLNDALVALQTQADALALTHHADLPKADRRRGGRAPRSLE